MSKLNPQIEIALRHFAEKMLENPDQYSVEDGQIMDRALRSCQTISDIDTIWVRWDYIGYQRGWTTFKEMVFKNGRYFYPY